MPDLKVTFPEPCSELWQGMTPRGCNRHCASCDAVVHDLAALTVNEAEHLLESIERVCVKASISPDSTVQTRKTSANSRRILATVGASMTLAAAACQTVPDEPIPGRFTLSGTMARGSWFYGGEVRAENGWDVDIRGPDGERKFSAINLYPGVYTLELDTGCGRTERIENIVIRDSDVDLGTLELETTCIIVGQMVREVETGQG